MKNGGYCGFLIHTERDVLIAGLEPGLAQQCFRRVANDRDASFVITKASEMVPLIKAAAAERAKCFSIHDDFTTRFGYSTGQAGKLGTRPSAEFLSRAIARGGPCSLHFTNRGSGDSLGSDRAKLRQEMVEGACKTSAYFRNHWVPAGRPRVTEAFRTSCQWIRAPFTLVDCLPLASNTNQV